MQESMKERDKDGLRGREGGWIKEKGIRQKERTGESLRQMSPSPQIDGSWPVSMPSFDPAVLCSNL